PLRELILKLQTFGLRIRALHRWPQDRHKTASSDKRCVGSALTCGLSAVNEPPAGGDKSMEIEPMKKIILSATVAMLLASPAFAQSYSSSYGTGNVIDQPALEHSGPAWQGAFQSGFQGGPQGAYAYEPPRAMNHKLRGVRAEAISPADPDVVYENGQYVGRDPDPNVRLELRRDWTHD